MIELIMVNINLQSGVHMRFIPFLMVCVIALSAINAPAHADDPILFDYSGKGPHAKIVREALEKEISPVEEEIGRQVKIAIGNTDLNRDGRPELLAYLPEETIFCTNENMCPAYVFAFTSKGLLEIGKFDMQGVYKSSKVTQGIHDLKIIDDYSKKLFSTYQWNGESYEKAGGN